MSKFKKKPVVIEAFQLPAKGDDNTEAFFEWAANVDFHNWQSSRDEGLDIETLEGIMRAEPGDWIIKGVKGEFYPCKPDIFEATYSPASLEVYKGHNSLAEMVSTHIENWRLALTALKGCQVSSDDVAYLDHELKALRDIESAIKSEKF